MRQASVQTDVIANLSSSNDLPLSFAINLRHYAISAKTSPLLAQNTPQRRGFS
jgi:hypothetical protein